MSLKRLFEAFRSAPGKTRGEQEEQAAIEYLIVGLGNPGARYARSRHNLGFITIERLAQQADAGLAQRRFSARFGRGRIDSHPVMLAEPQTYMNASGESVASLLGYFKLEPRRLIVIHDELDLPAGVVRIKRGGGDAGHRGIRSLIAETGRADFLRVRIGVGHPPAGRDPIGYLLEVMDDAELQAAAQWSEQAAAAVEAIVTEGPERAMNRINQRA